MCVGSTWNTGVKTLKSRLGWTTPRVRHPEQADLWTWLILAAYTQLRLARGVVADRRLPWEKPLPIRKLTPVRVLRSFVTLLPALGTQENEPRSKHLLVQGFRSHGRQPLPPREARRKGPDPEQQAHEGHLTRLTASNTRSGGAQIRTR